MRLVSAGVGFERLDARLVGQLGNVDDLEATLERRVGADKFPEFAAGGGSDQTDAPARDFGLEEVGHPRDAHDDVEFVDEEDDVSHGLAFLEEPPQCFREDSVLCKRLELVGLQLDDARVFQATFEFFPGGARGELFGDGALADAGVARENRVSLPLAQKSDDDRGYDLIPPDRFGKRLSVCDHLRHSRREIDSDGVENRNGLDGRRHRRGGGCRVTLVLIRFKAIREVFPGVVRERQGNAP